MAVLISVFFFVLFLFLFLFVCLFCLYCFVLFIQLFCVCVALSSLEWYVSLSSVGSLFTCGWLISPRKEQSLGEKKEKKKSKKQRKEKEPSMDELAEILFLDFRSYIFIFYFLIF